MVYKAYSVYYLALKKKGLLIPPLKYEFLLVVCIWTLSRQISMVDIYMYRYDYMKMSKTGIGVES